jgi:hypothetical protein
LVEQVSHAHGSPPLEVNVTTWAAIGQDTQSHGWSTVHARVEESHPTTWLAVGGIFDGRTAPNSSDRYPPTIGIRLTGSALAEMPLNVPERAVLDLVGRHPFLSTDVLGEILLDRSDSGSPCRSERICRRGDTTFDASPTAVTRRS